MPKIHPLDFPKTLYSFHFIRGITLMDCFFYYRWRPETFASQAQRWSYAAGKIEASLDWSQKLNLVLVLIIGGFNIQVQQG